MTNELHPRVELPAWHDRWMMGDRFGVVLRETVTKKSSTRIAHVLLDKSGRLVRVPLDCCTPL